MPNWKPYIEGRIGRLNLKPERELEIVEEISQHLQDRFDDLLASGVSSEEAQRLALEELRGDTLLADELRAAQHR